MEVIKSFTIDHTRLKPGIYVSREDKGFTTFDLRITEPNQEPAVAPAAMHSMEHLMATWFRNSEAKDDVVYVGPMGCLTGMYIIMTGQYTVENMRRLTIECLQWILTQDKVPAQNHRLVATICSTTCLCVSGRVLVISTVCNMISIANTINCKLLSTMVAYLLTHRQVLKNRVSLFGIT